MAFLDPAERRVGPRQQLNGDVEGRPRDQLCQGGEDQPVLADQERARRVDPQRFVDLARNDQHNRNL